MFDSITSPITGFMAGIFSPLAGIFSPLAGINPCLGLFIITSIITAIILLINKVFVNRKLMKSIKTQMTEIREQMTKAQKNGETENVNKCMNEYLKINSQFMKQSFKSMLISMVIIILFLPFVKSTYQNMTVATLPFSLPVVGSEVGWLFWYFVVAMGISWVVQKILRD